MGVFATRPAFHGRFEWDFLGFGLCRAWISVVFSLPAPALLTMGFDFAPWYFLPGAFACLALGLAGRMPSIPRTRTIALVVSASLSAAGFAGLVAGAGGEGAPPLLIGLACVGAGAGLLQTLWGDKMAALPARDINLYTVSGMLLAALLSILAWSAGSLEGGLLVFAALPLGSLILLYRGFDAGRWSLPRKEGSHASGTGRGAMHLGRLCLSIFVFVFVFNFAYTTLPLDTASGMATTPVRSVANIGVTVALLATLLIKGDVNRMGLYRLSFPVLLGALLLMIVVPGALAPAASIVAAAGYKLFDVLFWCVLVGLAHEHRERSWRVLGFGMAANFAGMGAGYGLRTQASAALAAGAVDPTLLACALMFALAVVTMLILPESIVAQVITLGHRRQRQEDASLAQRCSVVGESRQLTTREREVLFLLAQGRTQSVIARKLGIGEGTAHTHIIHVYQKMGIHSQQELIDIVEKTAL